MKQLMFIMLLLCGVSAHAGQFMQPDNLFPKVKFMTSHGDIVVELDRSRAPLSVNNFLSYVKKNAYNNTIFHRLVPGFVLQGGGYTPDYKEIDTLKPVFNESGNGLKNQLGSIAMARLNDPHSAVSQFYFNLEDNSSLDPGSRWGYAVFGQVVSGMEVLEEIQNVETEINQQTGWSDVPVEPVILKMVILLPQE
ncbi:peptidylprolyl isomerase [Alishewanella sp. SMS8]|uniref:peptidylprolyl isomerase n=1 Tax=Alishewanella sp. SMS8 TaxID=2994676 RepID=UPI00274178FE|nr:peptidylprolyl isomerase [Alishewanella sp. SMS8]MDP4946021.1 peptidylprolyl isomerase [Alishewanella sp.]MDP5188057.1 peptidylprolyl isomerase [Alishewanella sp.]MDP5205683.1 peptidylprolyl isomerase [Alishewanella sp. SMS9]MDP5458635.1 peptidylprolyl isomerase [Alishewanella sp. SMS8]